MVPPGAHAAHKRPAGAPTGCGDAFAPAAALSPFTSPRRQRQPAPGRPATAAPVNVRAASERRPRQSAPHSTARCVLLHLVWAAVPGWERPEPTPAPGFGLGKPVQGAWALALRVYSAKRTPHSSAIAADFPGPGSRQCVRHRDWGPDQFAFDQASHPFSRVRDLRTCYSACRVPTV